MKEGVSLSRPCDLEHDIPSFFLYFSIWTRGKTGAASSRFDPNLQCLRVGNVISCGTCWALRWWSSRVGMSLSCGGHLCGSVTGKHPMNCAVLLLTALLTAIRYGQRMSGTWQVPTIPVRALCDTSRRYLSSQGHRREHTPPTLSLSMEFRFEEQREFSL